MKYEFIVYDDYQIENLGQQIKDRTLFGDRLLINSNLIESVEIVGSENFAKTDNDPKRMVYHLRICWLSGRCSDWWCEGVEPLLTEFTKTYS